MDIAAEQRNEQALLERARRFAQPLVQTVSKAVLDVLLLRLGDEQYAVGLPFLRSVLPPQELTSIPCTPPYVAGLLNLRGEILTVLDLAVALQLRDLPSTSKSAQVILVEMPQVRVGLLVDEVLTVDRLCLETLDRNFGGQVWAAGVAGGTTVLLDLERLLTSDRFAVFDELG
ncbi:MAG: purine-binding chemotaxis protein CheW [Herpetosiphonaceae bacterium]|nr:purine-binding chemotaxis protein CheW [Herpetosiphonaceae bacterium]